MVEGLAIEKKPGETITATEQKLIDDLGSQAGLVRRNVALIADLRASRRRLMALEQPTDETALRATGG